MLKPCAPSTRAPGPLFDKLLPRRGIFHRLSNDVLKHRLEMHSKVNLTSTYGVTPCLEYQRSTRGGYGRLWDGEKLLDTHVLSWQLHYGPIPEGQQVLHHCDNPSCCEPTHLWLGTVADNMADRDRKGRNGGWKNRGHNRPSKARGEKHPLSKATAEQVRAIKRLPKAKLKDLPIEFIKPGGGLNKAAIARHYGLSDSLVRGILAGRNWAWLGG